MGYDPNEPRDENGRWTNGGGNWSTSTRATYNGMQAELKEGVSEAAKRLRISEDEVLNSLEEMRYTPAMHGSGWRAYDSRTGEYSGKEYKRWADAYIESRSLSKPDATVRSSTSGNSFFAPGTLSRYDHNGPKFK